MKQAAYDTDGIWGIADTEEEALQKAKDTLAEDLSDDDLSEAIDGLLTAPISDELLELLKDESGEPQSTVKEDAPFIRDDDGVLIPDPNNAGDEGDDDDVVKEDAPDPTTSAAPAAVDIPDEERDHS